MPTGTKTALLNSAERAARARGFDGFSFADLADEVGIRKASVHHHFPTKAALSVALMQRYCAGFKDICDDIERSEPTGGARLLALIAQYRSALGGGKTLCLCVSFSISRESLPVEVIAQISRFRQMMVQWLRGVFKAGLLDGSIRGVGDAVDEAAATLALIEGAQLAGRAEENLDLFDRCLRIVKQRVRAPV